MRAFLFLVIVAGCNSTPTTPPGPTAGALDITTDKGVVQGSTDGTVRSFLGIPYAAPPVDALRFLPPTPAAAWTTPRQATTFGSSCAQLGASGSDLLGGSDEDCLYLNVWLPNDEVKNAPVFVWIHGGGFVEGSGSDALYNGANIAATENVIVVTMNYRLGALGWLSHAAFATAEGVASSPSQGLLDQQAALKWVAQNIAAFGGDPTNVTLAGESAGGVSVCSHLGAPASKGLFARAIVESGICFSNALLFPTPATSNDQGARLATAVGCTDAGSALGCLQSKTPLELLTALPIRKALFGATGDIFTPTVDGVVLPSPPLDTIALGKGANVPTILGTNQNEGELFIYLWGSPPPTSADVRASLASVFAPANVDAIAAKYPVDSDPVTAFTNILTDGIFTCPTRTTARALAAAGVTTYLYQFTYPYMVAAIPNVTTSHSYEIPFVFRNGYAGSQLSDADVAMADIMDGYWFSFAKSGTPSGAVTWPTYSKSADQHLVLASPASIDTALMSATCDFWDSLQP